MVEAPFPADRVHVHGEFDEGMWVQFGVPVLQDHGGPQVVFAVGAWQEFPGHLGDDEIIGKVLGQLGMDEVGDVGQGCCGVGHGSPLCQVACGNVIATVARGQAAASDALEGDSNMIWAGESGDGRGGSDGPGPAPGEPCVGRRDPLGEAGGHCRAAPYPLSA